MTKFPVLHEEQVREFYYNVEFVEDDSLHTWVGNKSLYLDEELLEKILELPDMHCAGVQKKIMKGEYQLLFEFVNKVLLPRTEKHIMASSTDLFVMESLCKFEPLNLLALVLEHMYKTVIEHKGKHRMG
ncbi:hypothetical protein R3W88_012254 [Solanum pinnatisectum]|uniref:Uncharacterized protein n=1 Tax=Solanum pinnatisectum TaxID=50273 RepID=A0AAV9L8I9_9SOLN|nr:hypothetical protein R3W88_012254 [Solanum pinnatisectum]